MGLHYPSTSLFLCILIVFIASIQPTDARLSRHDFPQHFVFGTASSAYQYEGASKEGGRGPSIWDAFSLIKGKVAGNDNANVAIDQYHHYQRDVQLMSEMGMDAYRFSISWSRIFPEGRGRVNREGIEYYNSLINALLEHSIQPFVTLYHWDLPQALEDSYNGWLSEDIVGFWKSELSQVNTYVSYNWDLPQDLEESYNSCLSEYTMVDFAAYAETCFREFGDRVKHWITFNEANSFIELGYYSGIFAPNRCSKWVGDCTAGDSTTEPYIVGHHVILSHLAAIEIYRNKFQVKQGGSIGISHSTAWFTPLSNNTEDKEATLRVLDFQWGWFLDPLVFGDYPESMHRLVGSRLPKFTNEQKFRLKNSVDFLGLNHYTTRYVFDESSNPPKTNMIGYWLDMQANLTASRNGVPIGPQGASSWLYIVPSGMYNTVTYAKARYNNMPMYITENGVDELNNASLPLKQALQDHSRVAYYQEYLTYLATAIREGANVKGYFAWSLLDNFEWTSGYTIRFGLHFVDYNTLKRYPKTSARWFKRLLR